MNRSLRSGHLDAAQNAARRERDDLAEAFARVLLSDGLVGAQAPVFFLEPNGTMIWANDGYYGLAALLANATEAQRLLHPGYDDGPDGASSWNASARAAINGQPMVVRAHYAKLAYGPRSHVPGLAGDVRRELLLHREIPGLDISPVEVLRRSNHGEGARNGKRTVAEIRDLNGGQAIGEFSGRLKCVVGCNRLD